MARVLIPVLASCRREPDPATRGPERVAGNGVSAMADNAVGRLTGLDALVTAKEWERCAIVAAFTRDGGPGGGDHKKPPASSGRCSATEFAALGIQGLRSHNKGQRNLPQNWGKLHRGRLRGPRDPGTPQRGRQKAPGKPHAGS